MKTDTPETDAKREDVAMTTTALMVMTEHARKLERERNDAHSAIRWIKDSVGDQDCECVDPPEVPDDSDEPFGDPADHAAWCPIYLHDFCSRNLPENDLGDTRR